MGRETNELSNNSRVLTQGTDDQPQIILLQTHSVKTQVSGEGSNAGNGKEKRRGGQPATRKMDSNRGIMGMLLEDLKGQTRNRLSKSRFASINQS